jgi:hypothetical protein
MITWLFDRQNQWGFLPNLIKDETLKPGTPQWWDLCINPPFSYEFRFLKYCKLDNIPQDCKLVSDYITTTSSAYYPININFFDPEIDYISLMDPTSLARLKRGDFRILFYYSEGDNPDPEIYTSMDRMLQTHGLTLDQVKFVTANYKLRNKPSFVYFPDDEVYYRYLHILENNYVKEHNLQKRNKKFTCLIRADKVWRKIYANFIYQLQLVDDGYFSYTGYKYETSHCGLDDIDQWQDYDDTLVPDLLGFELQIPFKCDELSDNEHNNHKLIDHKFYTDAYFNFVVETHFDNDTCFLTEKTFKPILNLQPFIIAGNPGSLALLKDLGYKTFEDVIKESYDLHTDHRKRMSELIKISYDLCKLSDTHHMRIQSILADILQYNQKHFLAPKANRINKLLNELEY